MNWSRRIDAEKISRSRRISQAKFTFERRWAMYTRRANLSGFSLCTYARINTVQSHCGAHKLSAKLLKWFVGLGFIFVRCRFNKENENALIQKYCTVAHRHFMVAAEHCSWRIRGSAGDWSSRASFFHPAIRITSAVRASNVHTQLPTATIYNSIYVVACLESYSITI